MHMKRAIPALPVKHMKESVKFYKNQLGFTVVFQEEGFAVLACNTVHLHLWLAGDESWRKREHAAPVVSGAESYIAGTASCRIEVCGINEWYERMKPQGILHPNAHIRNQWWGEREFGVTDPDNNLITFFEIIAENSEEK
ncbi:MAG TPA: VOC family protein [Bacillales bacterium]|nr:VOC family protein [Bacillales bacterium]